MFVGAFLALAWASGVLGTAAIVAAALTAGGCVSADYDRTSSEVVEAGRTEEVLQNGAVVKRVHYEPRVTTRRTRGRYTDSTEAGGRLTQFMGDLTGGLTDLWRQLGAGGQWATGGGVAAGLALVTKLIHGAGKSKGRDIGWEENNAERGKVKP